MAISCVYCSGSHDTAADVRHCWSQHQTPAKSPERAREAPATVATARPMPLLGRNIVVRPGQAIPAGWETAGGCTIGDAYLRSPADRGARLGRQAADRNPCVFVIADDIASVLATPQTTSQSLH